MVRRGLSVAILGLLWMCGGASATPTATESTLGVEGDVTAALRSFITAFENLDWEPFRAAFTEDACVFHPNPKAPQRYCGRQAVEQGWRLVFDEIRKDAKGGAPYHRLPLESVHVQVLDAAVAVVSFELKNSERWGRRTVVFNKRDGVWKIVHLHASNFNLPEKAP